MNHFSIKFFCTIGSILSISLSLLKVWFRSNPEFSLHTHTLIDTEQSNFVCVWRGKTEHPDKRVFLGCNFASFLLDSDFPAHAAGRARTPTHVCAVRTHTRTAKATHSHVCAFLGGYRSWRCLTAACSACLQGLLRWTSEKLSHTCPWKLACVNFDRLGKCTTPAASSGSIFPSKKVRNLLLVPGRHRWNLLASHDDDGDVLAPLLV